MGLFDGGFFSPGHGVLGGLFGGGGGGGGGNQNPTPQFGANPFTTINPRTVNPGTPIFDPETGQFLGLQQPDGTITQPNNRVSQSEISAAGLTRALIQNLPSLAGLFNAQILPNELAQLRASQAVSPEYAQLQRDIFRGNALSEAQTTGDVLAGPGADIVRRADALSREIDPEFFRTRAATSEGINQLLQPGLTGGEREEIQRYLNQVNNETGTLTVPTNISTVSNASTFGRAARDRLSQAVNQATNFLPTSRTGVDVLQQATRQPSAISNAFSNVRSGAGEQATGLLGGLQSSTSGLAGGSIQSDTSKYLGRLQQPDTLDRVFQGLSAVSY